MFLLDKISYIYQNVSPFQNAMALSIILLCILYMYLRDTGVPPGPTGLPVLGYWPFLKDSTCHLQFQKFRKRYGEVFSFRAVGKLFICLGSIKSIREAHVTKSECFAGRYQDCLFTESFGQGLAFKNGEPWKAYRKFTVSKFKEYGMNAVKENAATAVYDAMKEVVEELIKAKGNPISMRDIISRKCMAVLRRIIFNDEGITIEEFEKVSESYSEMMKGLTSTNFLLSGKFARYLMFPLMPSIRKIRVLNKRIENIFSGVINRHKSEYGESHVADLVDCYFKERDDRRKKGDPTAAYFTDKALNDTLNQIATDGVQTIRVFVENFIITLVKHPEEQEKIYDEIRDVIGTDRLPALEDKTKLPYTNAFIYEVIRFTDFLPMFPSLECSKETTVNGYKIPAGSITILDFYDAHRNPNDFENPDEFNPSRYLASPGKQRPELPIIFGIGKRSCVGEAFSMIQTFLFVTTIVQNFRLTFPEGSRNSSLMFWSDEKLEICAHPRQHTSASK